MIIKKNIYWLLALLIIFSITLLLLFKFGKNSSKTKLETYFESNQIKELDRITDFVVEQITIGCEGDQIDCIYKYFDRYKGYDYEITGISKPLQSELLNSLSPNVFSDIWGTCKGTSPYSEDSVVNVESLCPKTDG